MLRELREAAGLGLESAGRRLEWSKAKMYRIENGDTPLRAHDVIAMCSVYAADPSLTEVLVALAAESKAPTWWHSYGAVIPAWFELYVGLEATASHLRHYEPGLVPGLLQTREYAAAVIRTKPGITDAEVDQAVALRLERQEKLLARRQPVPPRLDVILDEAVLRRPIKDGEGMRKQLTHLASVAKRNTTVSVRILPSAVGPHRASVAGAFVILDFPAEGARQPEPSTVYSESLTGALYLEVPDEVEAYRGVWTELEGQALSANESRDFLNKIAEEHHV